CALLFAFGRRCMDRAARDLPPAAVVGLRNDGTPDLLAISRSVIRRPGQVPALVRIAIDAWSARGALLRGRSLLGPAFGCPYYGEPAAEHAGEEIASFGASTVRSAGS